MRSLTAGLLITASAIFVGSSCRMPAPEGTSATPGIDRTETEESAPLPEPGQALDINAKLIARSNTLASPSEDATEQSLQRHTIYGKVEEMGPFEAADAADGQWMRITSLSGVRYVLVPGRLWVRSGQLNINKGDGIRAEGDIRTARGRTYLHADAISLGD